MSCEEIPESFTDRVRWNRPYIHNKPWLGFSSDYYYFIALVLTTKITDEGGFIPYLLRIIYELLPSSKEAWKLNRAADYSFKLMTPPCITNWPHVRHGGNFMLTPFSHSKVSANFEVTLLNTNNDIFFKDLVKLNKAALDHMYERNMNGLPAKFRKKIQKRCKNKTPAEIEAITRTLFHKEATVPIKTENGIQSIKIKSHSFKRWRNNLAAIRMRYVDSNYYTFDYEPNIKHGSTIQVVFTIKPWHMQGSFNYGLSYRLVPDIAVWKY